MSAGEPRVKSESLQFIFISQCHKTLGWFHKFLTNGQSLFLKLKLIYGVKTNCDVIPTFRVTDYSQYTSTDALIKCWFLQKWFTFCTSSAICYVIRNKCFSCFSIVRFHSCIQQMVQLLVMMYFVIVSQYHYSYRFSEMVDIYYCIILCHI